MTRRSGIPSLFRSGAGAAVAIREIPKHMAANNCTLRFEYATSGNIPSALTGVKRPRSGGIRGPPVPGVYPWPMQSYRWLVTVLLLLASNTFMTYAWYYHVKKGAWGLLTAILISWLIALPEYMLQVPANRLGHVDHGGTLTLPQLKVVLEAITLVVFSVFSIVVAKESLRKADVVALALVFLAVLVSMSGRVNGR